MQQCGDCLKVYDESENIGCPFCSDESDEKGHSLSLFQCEECSGSGKIECDECDGTGKEDWNDDAVCLLCNGAGELDCLDCEGTGWRQD